MRAVYFAYLLFQLWSHTYLFEEPDRSSRFAVKQPRLHRQLSQFRAPEQSGESSAESSPPSRAPLHTCPQCLGHRRPFTSVSDVSLPPANGTSSSLGFFYSRGTTPAPVLGSTVKLVRDNRFIVSSLPSREELHLAPQAHVGEGVNLEQFCDDELGVVNAKATSLDAHDEEKPRLSWTLTLALLVFVTIVGLSLCLFHPDDLSSSSWLPSMRRPWSNLWVNSPG
jgi:hypothetical protein